MSAGKALRLCGTWPWSASFPSTCLWSECPGRPQATCLGCVVGAGNGSLEAPWGHLSGWPGCTWAGSGASLRQPWTFPEARKQSDFDLSAWEGQEGVQSPE